MTFLVSLSLPWVRDVHHLGKYLFVLCILLVEYQCWMLFTFPVWFECSIWILTCHCYLCLLFLLLVAFNVLFIFFFFIWLGFVFLSLSFFFFCTFITAIKMKNYFIIYIQNFFWNFLTHDWLITTRGYGNHSQECVLRRV